MSEVKHAPLWYPRAFPVEGRLQAEAVKRQQRAHESLSREPNMPLEPGAERVRLKAAGRSRVSQLFPPPLREINHQNETRRGNVDESRNATQPEGLLRALFDDQVHDSRAWFMYSRGREWFGSYFGERMVFFGEAGRRDLALYGENGEVLARTTPHAEHCQCRTTCDAGGRAHGPGHARHRCAMEGILCPGR